MTVSFHYHIVLDKSRLTCLKWCAVGKSQNPFVTQLSIDISHHIVFIPELKNTDRRIQFIQHLQNVVAPNLFNPRVVYDGRALAYSPGKALPLAGGTGETVSHPFKLSMHDSTYIFHAQVLNQLEFQCSSTPRIKRILSNSVHSDQRYSHPPNVNNITIFLFNLSIEPLLRDVNALIHQQQPSTGALTATNLMQLIIRQGPNLYESSFSLLQYTDSLNLRHNTNNGRAYFPNDRSQIRDIGGALELWRGIFQCVISIWLFMQRILIQYLS